MELVQVVTLKLSNGAVGTFYGYPLRGATDPEVTVVDVEFESPRTVAGIQKVEAPPQTDPS